MTVEQLIVYGKKYIHSHEAKMLLSNVLGYDPLELLNHLSENVDVDLEEKYKELISARLNNYPLQYILGDVYFYGYRFLINEKVLIPRFETEGLVENVLDFIGKQFKNGAKVIDLGCGSGVIGITLVKKNPQLEVTCLDISDDALKQTKENSKLLDVQINVVKGDMLEGINEKYDIIVSNPPYIREDEDIEPIVKDNEPHTALYGGSDGLLYYKKILKDASKVLNDKFLIAFEIGRDQAKDIIELATTYLDNIEIEVKKDLSDNDRYVLIYNKYFI